MQRFDKSGPAGENAGVADVKVSLRDNGPLIIRGPVELLDASGERFEVAEGEALFLCRCGESGRKPFCDGTHKRRGFESAPRAAGK